MNKNWAHLYVICTLFTGQSSKEGIFMRYSFEFKKKCVEMYKKGIYSETPDGLRTKRFRDKIRHWVLLADHHGIDILKPKQSWKKWSADEKLVIVNKYLAGNSINSISIIEGINPSIISKWVYNYQNYGYNGLIEKKKGRPPMKKKIKDIEENKPRQLNESEYEELIRLREENEYLRTEQAVIKKMMALRKEKEANLLKAKKQE